MIVQRSWSGLCCLQLYISCLHYITLHWSKLMYYLEIVVCGVNTVQIARGQVTITLKIDTIITNILVAFLTLYHLLKCKDYRLLTLKICLPEMVGFEEHSTRLHPWFNSSSQQLTPRKVCHIYLSFKAYCCLSTEQYRNICEYNNYLEIRNIEIINHSKIERYDYVL